MLLFWYTNVLVHFVRSRRHRSRRHLSAYTHSRRGHKKTHLGISTQYNRRVVSVYTACSVQNFLCHDASACQTETSPVFFFFGVNEAAEKVATATTCHGVLFAGHAHSCATRCVWDGGRRLCRSSAAHYIKRVLKESSPFPQQLRAVLCSSNTSFTMFQTSTQLFRMYLDTSLTSFCSVSFAWSRMAFPATC